jgi:hypothetical protein
MIKLRKQPGFTFVELLFAIVIMGTLFSIALVVFLGMLRFYVFSNFVRQNQENGRNVLDGIDREIRFGQLLQPSDSTATQSSICVYNPTSQTTVKFTLENNELVKYQGIKNYPTFESAKTDVTNACNTNTEINIGVKRTSIIAKNMIVTAFDVFKTKGTNPTVYNNVSAVTIKFTFVTKTAGDLVNGNCEARNIYCNKITYNTAVELRGGDAPLATITGQKTTPTPSGLTYISQFGTVGTTGGQFNHPFGSGVDSNGNLFVVDQGNNRVQKFSRNGNFLLAFGWDVITGGGTSYEVCTVAANCKSGSQGTQPGQLYIPRGLAVDSSGNVYVADAGSSKIQKFNGSDGTVNSLVIGSAITNYGNLSAPSGVYVASNGDIYIADTNNYKMVKTSSSGTFISSFGSIDIFAPQSYSGYGPYGVVVNNGTSDIYITSPGYPYSGKLKRFAQNYSELGSDTNLGGPNNLAIDSSGYIYLADTPANSIRIYKPDLTLITSVGSAGSGNGQFSSPTSVSVDSAGYVYVSDYGNNRVQKFQINYQ